MIPPPLLQEFKAWLIYLIALSLKAWLALLS